MSIVTRWAPLKPQVHSSVYVTFFSDSHDDSIELANKNEVIPTVTNITFKGHKLHLFQLPCHY